MQRKYLGVVLALAVALVGGPTSMAAAQPIASITSVGIATAKAKPVKQSTANLNLRKSAAVKSASLLVIPKNTKLTVLRVSGAWNQVTYKSKTGWVSGSYLKPVQTAKAKVYNYTKAFTTVKAKATGSSASVLSIHRQTRVEVLGQQRFLDQGRGIGQDRIRSGIELGQGAIRPRCTAGSRASQPVFQGNRTTSKKLGTLANNTRIQWLRTSGSWQQVRTGAGIGWMQTSKLSNAAIKPPAKAKVYNYTKAFTTVKAKATGSSASVLSIHRQTKVEVLGNSGSWTRVAVSGKTGYVPASSWARPIPRRCTAGSTAPAGISRHEHHEQGHHHDAAEYQGAVVAYFGFLAAGAHRCRDRLDANQQPFHQGDPGCPGQAAGDFQFAALDHGECESPLGPRNQQPLHGRGARG